jgi:transposase InsO family protein/murein DD-endopeptidase MepM/ murein hydrolase activator NlpD
LCATANSHDHLTVQVELGTYKCSALIDSGAQGNFISPRTVNQYCLPWHKKEEPYRLNAVDGTEVAYGNGIIDMETDHLHVRIRDHTEQLSFDITETAEHQLILGIPWLRKNNPRIDWITGQIYWENPVPQKTRQSEETEDEQSLVPEDSTRTCAQTSPATTSQEGEKDSVPRQVQEQPLHESDEQTQQRQRQENRSRQVMLAAREHIKEIQQKHQVAHEAQRTKQRTIAVTSVGTSRQARRSHQDSIRKQVKPLLKKFVAYLQKAQKAEKDPQEFIPREYRKYKKLFSATLETGLPEHSKWDHEIPLKEGMEPKFSKIYGLNETQLKALREYLDENLAKGYIRPSTSPAGYPILFVPKKNGKLRLCVDYRQLNDITIKNRYPLPLIKELRDRLQGAQWFTALDLKGAYNLIRMKKGEEWKTAFRTRYGHFETLVMPFGLTNAPATFQAMINHVLREYLDVFVIAYLDDILIYSKTLENHKEHVHKVLQTLQDAKLLVEPEKSKFHTQEVDYLGYTIRPGEIRMQASKIEAIRDWPSPTNLKEVRGFLGFVNFYRQFIKDYSKIAKPLTDLTKTTETFQWNDKAQEAFEEIRQRVISEPILVEADPDKEYEVETDASDYALGGQLGQRDAEGKLHPIAFFSKKLSGPEVNYGIPDKELMAIIEAFKEWQHYLIGAKHQVRVFTDHKNLTSFTTTKELNKRQIRWAEFLSQFDIRITYRKGSENGRADALSRRLDHLQEVPPETQSIFQVTPEGDLLQEPRQLAAILRAKPNPEWENKLRTAYQELPDQDKKGLVEDKGMLYQGNKLFVPMAMQSEVIRRIHEAPAHGHQGITATIKRVRRHYNFPWMKEEVQKVIQDCDICCKSKTARHKPYGLLQPLPVPEGPWQSISLDFIVKLPPSKEPLTGVRYDSILVIVDRFTKYAYFLPYKEASNADDLAYTFLRTIISNHGAPQEIISDRGTVFTSNFWQSLMKQLGTKSKLSTAFHPQTDGQTERLNQILEQYLRSYVNHQQDNWVQLLPMAQFAYNSADTSTTKMSPFYANYMHEPEAYREPISGIEAQTATEKATKIRKLHKELRQELLFVQERMTIYANKKRLKGPTLEEGDKVYLLRKNIKTKRPSDKLDYKKIGPFRITEKLSEVNFRLSLPKTRRHAVFHISLLEPAPANARLATQIELENDEREWEVEEIRNHRIYDNETEYLIKWKGYDNSENTWEPVENLTGCKQLLEEYQARNSATTETRTTKARPTSQPPNDTSQPRRSTRPTKRPKN